MKNFIFPKRIRATPQRPKKIRYQISKNQEVFELFTKINLLKNLTFNGLKGNFAGGLTRDEVKLVLANVRHKLKNASSVIIFFKNVFHKLCIYRNSLLNSPGVGHFFDFKILII